MSKAKFQMNRNEAIISIVLCIITGSFFVASNFNWNFSVSREDTTELVGCFEYMEYNHIKTNYVKLCFSDIESRLIDGACVSNEFEESLHSLEYGTVLHMLVDEKSGYVMELRVDDNVLLEFDYSLEMMRLDRLLFLCLGVVMFAIAFGIAVKISPKRKRK